MRSLTAGVGNSNRGIWVSAEFFSFYQCQAHSRRPIQDVMELLKQVQGLVDGVSGLRGYVSFLGYIIQSIKTVNQEQVQETMPSAVYRSLG